MKIAQTLPIKNKTHEYGSSLIGVALLSMALGFLITGALYLMKNYDLIHADQKNIETSRAIQSALNDFMTFEGRLPCPAPMTARIDTPTFGKEAGIGAGCNGTVQSADGRLKDPLNLTSAMKVIIGTVPIRSLHLPDKMIVDGYGKRYIYAVTEALTMTGTDIHHDLGAITIQTDTGTNMSDSPGVVSFVLISPGADDRGAYDINGNLLLPCGNGTNAGENCKFFNANNLAATFISTVNKSFGNGDDSFTHSFAFQANGVPYRWAEGKWNKCDGQCDSGTQQRPVQCIDHQGLIVPVAEEENIDKCGPQKPEAERICPLKPCYWTSKAWSLCTRKDPGQRACDSNATKFRSIVCHDHKGVKLGEVSRSGITDLRPFISNEDRRDGIDFISSIGSILNNPLNRKRICPRTRPTIEENCQLGGCTWKVDPWGPCGGVCKTGIKYRTVTCRGFSDSATGIQTQDSDCVASGAGPKPPTSSSCGLPKCYWDSPAWGPCNGVCFSGTQNRPAAGCHGYKGEATSNGRCEDPTPITNRSCTLGACTWNTTSWSTCTAGGGGGGGGKVLCGHFFTRGILSAPIYQGDVLFAQRHVNSATKRGYRLWAVPLTRYLNNNPNGLVEKMVQPFVVGWATEMAYRTGYSDKGHWLGKVEIAISQPIINFIGLFVKDTDWSSLNSEQEIQNGYQCQSK